MSKYVLDASALLALLQQEPGAEIVAAVLQNAFVSTVNWSEVIQKALVQGIETDDMQSDFEVMGVKIMPFSVSQAELAAQIWKKSKSLGLSLGDRACLALAVDQQAIVLTADSAWAKLDTTVKIQIIR